MSYAGHSLSVVLPLCRDAVGVFREFSWCICREKTNGLMIMVDGVEQISPKSNFFSYMILAEYGPCNIIEKYKISLTDACRAFS